jgi:hypothetical protein
MDIKFKNDVKNNKMLLTIKLSKRVLVGDKHVTVGWRAIEEIVQNKYKCPDTHVLGACHDRRYNLDNNYDQLLEKTYVFDLLPKSPPVEKKPVVKKTQPAVVAQNKKKSTRKITTKRTKKTTVKK